MPLMFLTGTANVGRVLLLGLVMAAEKVLRDGRRMAAPLGRPPIAPVSAVAVVNVP